MRKILLATIPLVLLSSCWGGVSEPPTSSSRTGKTIQEVLSESGRNAAIAEIPGYLPIQEKIERDAQRDRLSTLTPENLDAMTATGSEAGTGGGQPKTLENRTLFFNYLKERDIRSPSDVLEAMAGIGAFAARENVRMTDADLMVLLAGLRVSKPGIDICEGVDSVPEAQKANRYYSYLLRTCGTK